MIDGGPGEDTGPNEMGHLPNVLRKDAHLTHVPRIGLALKVVPASSRNHVVDLHVLRAVRQRVQRELGAQADVPVRPSALGRL